jgi:uncharacterized protein
MEDHPVAPEVQTTAPPQRTRRDRLGETLPLRQLGRTGELVTMLGVGGWHIGRMSEKEAGKTIETALEGGIRFFDTAEGYQEGGSETRMGRFLVEKHRDLVFLMTKTTAKTADEARKHLEGSLRRLNTDRLDLWQMHSVDTGDDVDSRLANGVLDIMEEAKAAGKTRYIGFTGHRAAAAHLRVLEATDAFDCCQMPVNVADAAEESFIRTVLPQLVARDLGVLAMKTLANGGFFGGTEQGEHGPCPCVIPDKISVEDALHFVWSLPVSVLISGSDSANQLQETVRLARAFTGMSETERAEFVAKVGKFDRLVEFYKEGQEPDEQ